MTREQFIEKIAPIVVKYASQYNVLCPSAVIAQAVLESDGGNSELATNACNYFGLKYRANRCPSACGIYYKKGSEQNADGSYVVSNMQWMKFANMDAGVKGYFDFTNISNYASVKGVKDPKTYLENIKKAGYATGLKYVDNVYAVVQKYNLTKYDNIKESSNSGGNKMVINTHAGHNPDGKVACGAIGYIKESTEARKIQSLVNEYLRKQGHTVYDCTVDNGTSKNDVLKKIVVKCNTHKVDLDVSIHFNASAKKTRDDKTTGTEVFVYSSTSKAKDEAQRICNAISEVGFTNRGVKNRPDLYVLRKTSSPALLIEVCFVDDPEDVDLYNANIDKIARKIAKGITGVEPSASASTSTSVPITPTPSSTPSLKTTATKKGVQTYLNTYYGDEIKAVLGAKLTVDGIFGEKSKKAVAIALQTELNKLGASLKVDGLFGSGSSSAFIKYVGSLKKGSKGIFVTLWQCLLVGLGYNPNGIDGDAGNGFVKATNLCLKAYGLSGDSVVNGADINKIL